MGFNTLEGWVPIHGALTNEEALIDAIEARIRYVNDSGMTPANALVKHRSLGLLFDAAVLSAMYGGAHHFKATEAAFVENYLTYPSGANNIINGIKLNRYLASQQQMGEPGEIIAGASGTSPFRDAPRVVNMYGGQASDWVKMSSSAYTGVDGFKFETHWVQNMQTGLRVEFKTKIIGWGFLR